MHHFLLANELFATLDVTLVRGGAATLSLMCLMQYAWHTYSKNRSSARREALERELHSLEAEVQEAHRERTLTNFENQLLRDFVAQAECEKAIGLLLRRCVPNAEYGCAAFLQFDRRGTTVCQTRGFSTGTEFRLTISANLRRTLSEQNTLLLEGRDLQGSEFWSMLSPGDRAKIRRLHVLAVGQGDDLLGAVLTTDLVPAGVGLEQQREVAKRLMACIGFALKDKLRLQAQQDLLRWNTELSELRTIVDQTSESTPTVIEDFIQQLTRRLDASQGVLYLCTSAGQSTLRRLVTCGDLLPEPLQIRLWNHQLQIAQTSISSRDVLRLDSESLTAAGIDSLVGAAIVFPLFQSGALLGTMVFVRQQCLAFGQYDDRLGRAAGEMLASLILRAANQVSVERAARLDGLTGLANRRTFDEQIAAEVQAARATGSECSLLLFDLDRFKSVNDTYGHQAGDAVLRAAAGVLQEKVKGVRSSDRALCARYGGEELAILLPRMGVEGATRLAEAIRITLQEREISAAGHRLHITTSVGLATMPDHAQDVEDLISIADTGLYQAKQAGRNRLGIAVKATTHTAK